MPDELKKNLQKAQQELTEALDDIEETLVDVSEDSIELWQRSRDFLKKIGSTLADEIKVIEQNRDEIKLQTHLAVMETRERAEALHQNMAGYFEAARQKSRATLDAAQVQTALAKMEARDFASEAREELDSELREDSSKIQEATLRLSEQLSAVSTRLKTALKKK